jgi:hypothetical protein
MLAFIFIVPRGSGAKGTRLARCAAAAAPARRRAARPGCGFPIELFLALPGAPLAARATLFLALAVLGWSLIAGLGAWPLMLAIRSIVAAWLSLSILPALLGWSVITPRRAEVVAPVIAPRLIVCAPYRRARSVGYGRRCAPVVLLPV